MEITWNGLKFYLHTIIKNYKGSFKKNWTNIDFNCLKKRLQRATQYNIIHCSIQEINAVDLTFIYHLYCIDQSTLRPY